MTNEQFFTGTALKQTDYRAYTRKDGTQGQIATFLFEENASDRPQQKLVCVWDAATIQWLQAHTGEEVRVRFDTRVREYNGRYYEDANAISVTRDGENVRELPLDGKAQQPQPQAQYTRESDELPF